MKKTLTNPLILSSRQDMVLLCPPYGCQATGCGGQLIVEKDVPACGVDTSNSTAIGTIYRLPFVVYDKGGLNATVDRVIKVIRWEMMVGGWVGMSSS